MEDAGSWMVVAHNGIGKVARKQISLSVYPGQVPITVRTILLLYDSINNQQYLKFLKNQQKNTNFR